MSRGNYLLWLALAGLLALVALLQGGTLLGSDLSSRQQLSLRGGWLVLFFANQVLVVHGISARQHEHTRAHERQPEPAYAWTELRADLRLACWVVSEFGKWAWLIVLLLALMILR